MAWRQQGSLAAPDWLPLAILAALLVATIAAAGSALRPPRLVLAGAGALLALAVWAAASTAWSPRPAGARDEALLTALYVAVLMVPVLTLRGPKDQWSALRLVVLVLGVLSGLSALKLALAAHPASLLFGGRFDFPVSYVNASSALFILGFWPAMVIAAARDARPETRAAATGAGGLFLALAITTQSKGTVLGLAVSAVLVFTLAPVRLRLLAPTLLAAAPAAAAFATLTAPYRSSAISVAHRAGWTALAVSAVAAVLGAVYAVVDRRVEISPDRQRVIGRSVFVVFALGVVAAVTVFAVSVPAPRAWASKEWTAFKHQQVSRTGSTHLTSLGSNRYDFWRVALDEAAAHPLRGIGGRGFYSAYLEHRRSQETPLRAHSLFLDALAELGVPGLLLLLLGLGAPLVFVARRLSQPCAVAAFATATYFLTHAAIDWIWTVPVVGVPAFLVLGIGCADAGRRPLPGWAAVATAVVAVAVALLAFAPPWLAHRYVVAAYSTSAPAADLSRARWLDPLSLEPYWADWRLAGTLRGRADALHAARRVEPQSVAVLYQLGLDYLRLGQRVEATNVLRRASALDPREDAIRKALQRAIG
jgi:hypothetical protein